MLGNSVVNYVFRLLHCPDDVPAEGVHVCLGQNAKRQRHSMPTWKRVSLSAGFRPSADPKFTCGLAGFALVNQPTNQPINQSVNQSINQGVRTKKLQLLRLTGRDHAFWIALQLHVLGFPGLGSHCGFRV